MLHAVAGSAAALGGREGSAMTDAVKSDAALAGLPESPPGSPVDTTVNVRRPPSGRGKELPQVRKLQTCLKQFDVAVEGDVTRPLQDWLLKHKALKPKLDKVHRKRIDREYFRRQYAAALTKHPDDDSALALHAQRRDDATAAVTVHVNEAAALASQLAADLPAVYTAASGLMSRWSTTLAEVSSVTSSMASDRARATDASAQHSMQEFAAGVLDLAARTSHNAQQAAAGVASPGAAAGAAAAGGSGGSPGAPAEEEYVVRDEEAEPVPLSSPATPVATYVREGAPPSGTSQAATRAGDYPASNAQLAAFARGATPPPPH